MKKTSAACRRWGCSSCGRCQHRLLLGASLRSGSFTLLNFCIILCNLLQSNNLPAEQQLLLRRELEINGKPQLCRGSKSAFCCCKEQRGKGCSVWNFFFLKWWFSKRGTKQRNLPSHCLPSCKGLIWARLTVGLICNQRIGQNHVLLSALLWCIALSAPGSPQAWPQPEKSGGTLVPEQRHPCKAKGFSLRYLHGASTEDGLDLLREMGGREGSCASRQSHFDKERKCCPQQ